MSDQLTPAQASASEPVTSGPGHVFNKLITTVTVKARSQCKLPIGTTVGGLPPKGFSIELKPGPVPAEAVTVQVSTRGSHRHYDFILHIANDGGKAVRAEIWQM